MTYKLSNLYEEAGMENEARRVAYCSTYPTFGVTASGQRRLITNNSCKLRLCPVCNVRRAHRLVLQLSRIMDRVALVKPNVQYIFLTLTVQNVPGADLGSEISHLTESWNKLMQHREVTRAIGGWYRAIEITREKKRFGWYHPHIHAVLAVDPGYFDRKLNLFLTHEQWMTHWQKALQAAYRPSVRVQRIKATQEATTEETQSQAELEAVKEAAKYPLKSGDYINTHLPKSKAVQVLLDYSQAIRGRRMIAYGGWLKEAARDLDEEDAERLTDQERLRDEVITLLEHYHWSFGARDYIFDQATTPPPPLPKDNQDNDQDKHPASQISATAPPEQLEIPGVRGGMPR